MIAKIQFFDVEKKEAHTMLFGNNYKRWEVHYEEYCRMFKQLLPIKFEVSRQRWTGYGLKWIAEENMQKQLDEMEEPEEKGRVYSTWKFEEVQLAKLPR